MSIVTVLFYAVRAAMATPVSVDKMALASVDSTWYISVDGSIEKLFTPPKIDVEKNLNVQPDDQSQTLGPSRNKLRLWYSNDVGSRRQVSPGDSLAKQMPKNATAIVARIQQSVPGTTCNFLRVITCVEVSVPSVHLTPKLASPSRKNFLQICREILENTSQTTNDIGSVVAPLTRLRRSHLVSQRKEHVEAASGTRPLRLNTSFVHVSAARQEAVASIYMPA